MGMLTVNGGSKVIGTAGDLARGMARATVPGQEVMHHQAERVDESDDDQLHVLVSGARCELVRTDLHGGAGGR